MPESKLALIRQHAVPQLNRTITHYQTAELQDEEGDWQPYPDLPLKLYFEDGSMLSIVWSNFDDLWMSQDEALPFEPEDSTVRWVTSQLPDVGDLSGCRIHSILLGRGQMTVGTMEMEIWTRLLLDLGDCWLEVFNALDENGYARHTEQPAGQFVDCTPQG